MILGFPCSSKPVMTTPSEEASEFIRNIVQEEFPSIELLCSLLTNDLDDASFKVIFMLLIVNVFIAPNESGVANPAFYGNFLHVHTIQQLDWSCFTLDCLLQAIDNYLFNKSNGIETEVLACKILLVVSNLYIFIDFLFHSS
jgi:hypothetical protein